MNRNPVLQYMTDQAIGSVELAIRLGVSKGYASLLKDGRKPITPRIAKQLAALTGQPWWEYMPADAASESHVAGAAA